MIKIISIGDIFLGGDVIGRSPDEVMSKDILTFLKSAELVIGNLEAPFVQSEIYEYSNLPFPQKLLQSTPANMVYFLKEAGISYVSLANNHLFDFGEKGLLETLQTLKDNGIKYSGAGQSYDEATRPAVFFISNKKISLFSFCEINDYLKLIVPARDGSYGVNILSNQSIDRALELSKDSDVKIACIHWGREHISYPSPEQVEIAKGLVKKGFHIIIGNHAHLPQRVDYNEKFSVAYSHGNFLFPQFIYSYPGYILHERVPKRISKNIPQTYDLPVPVKQKTIKKWTQETCFSEMIRYEIQTGITESPLIKTEVKYVVFDQSNCQLSLLSRKEEAFLEEKLYKSIDYNKELSRWKKRNIKKCLRQINFQFYFPENIFRCIHTVLLLLPWYKNLNKLRKRVLFKNKE